MSPKKVLGITKDGIENKTCCNDIMSIMYYEYYLGRPTTGCTSDDRTST